MGQFRFLAVRRLVRLLLPVALAACASPLEAADAVLYRVFLRDGSAVVSYGQFARVADLVVLSIPLAGLETDSPELQLVTLPESVVDWDRTEDYAEAAKAKHYADTRGEAEFARLSEQIAETLNAAALIKDPGRRLTLADSARRLLAEWPARNYGYRAQDVSELSSLLDEVVSELRVAAGQSRFDLSFVTTTAAPPATVLLPPPSFFEQMQQAFTLAGMTADPAERLSLLIGIVRALEPARAEPWAAALHVRASADLTIELQIEAAYADLAARTLTAATQRARRADVKGIETLVKEVLLADDRLGRRRAQSTAALLNALESRLADARRLRLARDGWAARRQALRQYQQRLHYAMEHFRRSAQWLEDIKGLSGPSPEALGRLAERAGAASRDLSLIRPPAGTETAHAMLGSAFQMAARAAVARETAVHTSSMETAWHASSAAAGALLMFERALLELQRLATPPTL